MKISDIFVCSALLVTSIAVFHNALRCGFVFDDVSAVKENKDILPSTPFMNLMYNDFWGTPMVQERSHKSYRPLCVLTFRLNYIFGGLDPLGYHLTNIILHAIVSLQFYMVCRCTLGYDLLASAMAAVLFVVHPIHTEAVTGVVGRAELLSAMFALFTFTLYANCAKSSTPLGGLQVFFFSLLIAAATLSKEQGITVVGVCVMYEIFIIQQLSISRLPMVLLDLVTLQWSKIDLKLKYAFQRSFFIMISAFVVLAFRIKVMGAQLPAFTIFDNPAAMGPLLTRILTYNYLLAVNCWLLICPAQLCCDWTMGTVPLVETVTDFRNGFTILFYVSLYKLGRYAVENSTVLSEKVLMGLAFMCIPFLPASNLFFPVGFVIAERILYFPSTGYCLIFGVVFSWIYQGWNSRFVRYLLTSAAALLVIASCLRTFTRNTDWTSEYTLFSSALRFTRNNAKVWNNVGHALEGEGRYSDALQYFRNASLVQPDDIGSHLNVGRTLKTLGDSVGAEHAFQRALHLLPAPIPGQKYTTRIAPSHLNVFISLGNLISANESRLAEVEELYRKAIRMRSDFVQAHINLGDVLLKRGKAHEAIKQYHEALSHQPDNADIHYNLGVVHLELSNHKEAFSHFNDALQIDPMHKQALFNSALMMQDSGDPSLKPEAERRLRLLLSAESGDEKIFFNLGMLATDNKDYQSARQHFEKALEINPGFKGALFNLALLLSNDLKQPLSSIPYLKTNLGLYPDHIKSWLLLGDIAINHLKDLDLAEKCFGEVIKLDSKHVQGQHNMCVVHSERGHLQEAEQCLERVLALSPKEEYIQQHLAIIRRKRREQSKRGLSGSP